MRKITRRQWLKAAAGTALLASWPHLPVGTHTAESDEVPLPFEGVTLDFLHMSVASIEEPFRAALEALAAEFHRQTGAHVRNLTSDWSVGFDRVRAAAVAGGELDVTQVGAPWPAELEAIGAFSPLDLEEFGGADRFLPAALATAVIEGRAVALPFSVDTRALIYRADVLEELGLLVPRTLEELKDVAQKISRRSRLVEFGFGLPGSDPTATHYFAMWLWAFGGEIVRSPLHGAEILFNREPGRAALLYWVDLIRAGAMPRACAEWTLQQKLGAFLKGQIAMTFGFPFEIPIYSEAFGAESVGVALPPEGPAGRFVFAAGSHLMLFKEAPQEAARAWMGRLVEPAANVEIMAAIHNLSPLRGANALLVERSPFLEPFVEGFERFGRNLPLGWGVIEALLLRAIAQVLGAVATGTFVEGVTIPEELDRAAEAAELALHRTFG